jgi:hypothetical protein
MKYGILFLTVGIVLGVEAVLLGGAYWLLAWPGLSFELVSLACLRLGARVFGKRPKGTGKSSWNNSCEGLFGEG